MDVDAAGGAVTGGLIAGAIERPTGKAGEVHHGPCTDCGEPTTGRFCSNCGQPTHSHRTLLHLVEEVLHGVLHFDGRIWRTLPLLILNPGRLTREWVFGKRSRYVSPLAMFLFTVFLMFFVFSFSGGVSPTVAPIGERVATQRADVAEAEAALAAAQAEQRAAPNDQALGSAVVDAAETLERERQRLAVLEGVQRGGKRSDDLEPGSWQAELADGVHAGDVTVNTGFKSVDKAILKKLKNPDLALYKIQQTLYKFAFLLVPLSIPFVWLLFLWRRGFTLYDHGVFVLYSLTFMALIFMVGGLIGRGPEWLGALFGTVATIGVPVHMYAQLKGAYSLSWFSALWRLFVLLVFCSIVITLFVFVTIVLGLAG